jgi:DNA-directed RNA polymerase beta' subunit
MPQPSLPLSQIQVTLASPERIRQWAERTLPNGKRVGQVTHGATLSHQTMKPEPNGLFCERIFGPLRDFQCACGKRDRPINPGNPTSKRLYCKICEVEFTWSVVRRYRMGYISLAAPVTHPWYIKPAPCWMGVFFDFKPSVVYGIVYGGQTLTLEHAMRHNFSNLDGADDLFAGFSTEGAFSIDRPKQGVFQKGPQLLHKQQTVRARLMAPFTIETSSTFYDESALPLKKDGFLDPLTEQGVPFETNASPLKRKTVQPIVLDAWRSADENNYLAQRLALLWPKKWVTEGAKQLWQKVYGAAFGTQPPFAPSFRRQLKTYYQDAICQKMRKELFSIVKTVPFSAEAVGSNFNAEWPTPKMHKTTSFNRSLVRKGVVVKTNKEKLLTLRKLKNRFFSTGTNRRKGAIDRRLYVSTRLKLARLKRTYDPHFLNVLRRLQSSPFSNFSGKTVLMSENDSSVQALQTTQPPLRPRKVFKDVLNLTRTVDIWAEAHSAGVKRVVPFSRKQSPLFQSKQTPRDLLQIAQSYKRNTQKRLARPMFYKAGTKPTLSWPIALVKALNMERRHKLRMKLRHLSSSSSAGKKENDTLFARKLTKGNKVKKVALVKTNKTNPRMTRTWSKTDYSGIVKATKNVNVARVRLPKTWRRVPVNQVGLQGVPLYPIDSKNALCISASETLAGQLHRLTTRGLWALRPVMRALQDAFQRSRWQNVWLSLPTVGSFANGDGFLFDLPGIGQRDLLRGKNDLLVTANPVPHMTPRQVYRQRHWEARLTRYENRCFAFCRSASSFLDVTFQNGTRRSPLGVSPETLESEITKRRSMLVAEAYATPTKKVSFEPVRRQAQPMYTVSHRDRWPFEDEWLEFSAYMAPSPHDEDMPTPLYADLVQTEETLLAGLPATAGFSTRQHALPTGAGVLQRMLRDYSPHELRKQDQQNRTFFESVIVRMRYLHQVVAWWRLQPDPKGKSRRGKWPKYGKRNMSRLRRAREGLLRRSKLVRKMMFMKTEPLHMILSVLPVLPPDLRPIVQMGDVITASDLNRLYQRVLHRNQILQDFLRDLDASGAFEIQYAQRMLQEAVDNLIENGKGGIAPESDPNGRPLKSLADVLKGKQGRFRQHLLGKRVDYSGRSVIVVGPQLRMHECGIPREMALELFLPFLLRAILTKKITLTVMGAKQFIRNYPLQTNQLLQEIMRNHPVVMNRAPTLHRLGFQAFQPRLVHGRAILLHPLVCPPFNADFDGDQMAVHVPITAEARAEAWKLMFTRNNVLSPATGDPIILPSQDMVLGCYYLTTWQRRFQKGMGRAFGSIAEVLQALNHQQVDLHAPIWVRWRGSVKQSRSAAYPLEMRFHSSGHCQAIFPQSQCHLQHSSANEDNLTLKTKKQDPWIYTTPGRVLFHSTVQQTVAS